MIQTYEIEIGPKAMQWQEYENLVRREWQLLLDSNPHESSILRFLSEHPALLCGAVASTAAGSYPMRAMVIVQPPLQAVVRRVPDFLFIGEDSATVYPTFIEIERPSKKWFNAKSYPSQQFTQAVSQLREWQTWFAVGHNQSVFVEQFDLASLLRGRRLQPWYILVLGRRSEFHERSELLSRRAVEQKTAEAFMTF